MSTKAAFARAPEPAKFRGTKVVFLGTGSLFKNRAPIVNAFTALGAEVQAYPTFEASIDVHAPTMLTRELLRDVIPRADLTFLALMDPAERGPSVTALELAVISKATNAMGLFAFGCDSGGFDIRPEDGCDVVRALSGARSKVAFAVAPLERYDGMRTVARLGMRFFPQNQWGDEAAVANIAEMMLDYTRAN